MIDHECPECSTVFQAFRSPTNVPRTCPSCGAEKAHPARRKSGKKAASLPTGVVGLVIFVLCFLLAVAAPLFRALAGFGLVAMIVTYAIAAPLCVHGLVSTKEKTASKICGVTGLLLIAIVTVAEIVLRSHR